MGKYDNWFKINSISNSPDDWLDENKFGQNELSENIKIENSNINNANIDIHNSFSNIKFKRMDVDGIFDKLKEIFKDDITIYIVMGSVIVILLIIILALIILIKNKKKKSKKIQKANAKLTTDEPVTENQKDTKNAVTIDINAIPSDKDNNDNSETPSNKNKDNDNTIQIVIPSSGQNKTNDVPKPEQDSSKTQNEGVPKSPTRNQSFSSSSSPTEEMNIKDKCKSLDSDSISIEDFNHNLQLWTNDKSLSEVPSDIQDNESINVDKFNENLQLWTNSKVPGISESIIKKEIKPEETKLEETKLEETKLEETKLEETKPEETKQKEVIYEIEKTKSIISSESNEEIDADFRNNLKLWTNGNIPGYEFAINKGRISKLYESEKEKSRSIISSESNEEIDPAFKDNLNLWMNGSS